MISWQTFDTSVVLQFNSKMKYNILREKLAYNFKIVFVKEILCDYRI